jgi:hypothetical protein
VRLTVLFIRRFAVAWAISITDVVHNNVYEPIDSGISLRIKQAYGISAFKNEQSPVR